MTIQMNAKVRLVRCPSCRKVLPELVEVPVYQCGGCGTVLQAKIRKNDTKGTGLCCNEVVPCQKNDLEHCSEDGQGSSVSQEATLANGVHLPGKSGEGDQNEFEDCNLEQPGHGNISDEVPSSTELPCHGNEEPSAEAAAHVTADEEQCALDQYNEDRYRDCDMKRAAKMSVEASSSAERNHHLSMPSLLETETNIEVDECKYSLKQRNRRDQNELKNCRVNFPENMSISKEKSSSSEFPCHEIEEPSSVAEVQTDNENLESHFIFRSSSAENILASVPSDSVIIALSPLGESVSPDSIKSGDNEQLMQTEKNPVRGFDHVSSLDTLENVSLTNPSSDLSVTVRGMSKSPTTKSHCAYDGSVSSYDGADEQVSDGHLHLSKRNFKDAGTASGKGLSRRDEFMVNNMMKSDSQMQHQTMKSLSIPTGKRHHVLKGNSCPFDELIEPTGHGHHHSLRRRIKLENDEHLSRMPFYLMGTRDAYGHDSPIHRHHVFQCCSNAYSHKRHPEPDKMELLRMVYELQNQLNRTYVSRQNANGRLPARVAGKEKQTPLYYNHFAHEGEIYADLSHPRYSGGYSQGRNWPQQCKISRQDFLSTHDRYEVDCSCFHCSRELPPHVTCCNKEHCTPYAGYNCHTLYHLNSSPRYYSSSKFSTTSHDTKSEGRGREDHEMKRLYSRKQHVRPVAGGAPMVSCYRCSELLQLPADFLVFKRRWHRLRCDACSEVLKFSLCNRTHVVADAIAPPPSETDNVSYAGNSRQSAAASHANDCANAEPVSYSDDYGKSFCRSCSTDGDIHNLKGNSRYGKISSNSSFESMEDRKKFVSRESQGKCKNSMENFESAGPSSKMTKLGKLSSEIEELPQKTGSPLHKLLGYSSPSQVINR